MILIALVSLSNNFIYAIRIRQIYVVRYYSFPAILIIVKSRKNASHHVLRDASRGFSLRYSSLTIKISRVNIKAGPIATNRDYAGQGLHYR